METNDPGPPPVTLTVRVVGLPEALAGLLRGAHPADPTPVGPAEPAPLLDTKALARRLSVSVRTVDTLVAEGEIAVTRVRGQRRFTPEAVDAYLRSRSRRGAA